MTTTIVLGAGLSGLTAARQLIDAGHDVVVIDKGRGVGGRLATRRIGEGRLDHGAQFFTTRSDEFKALVAAAVEDGVVIEWCRGFAEEDGHPRYRGATGMTDLAKWLAQGIDVRTNVHVDQIVTNDGTVTFLDGDASSVATGDQAVVTAPVPQMIALFDKGNIAPPPELDHALRAVEYFATLALLAVVDGQPNIDEPGGMQLVDEPFTFIADNQRKGISTARALTFHAEHDFSLRRYDDDPAEVHAALIEQAQPWLGDATIIESQLKKWRYAGPVTPLPEPTYVIEQDGTRIALAGDAFAGPKVEGAFNSGRHAGLRLS